MSINIILNKKYDYYSSYDVYLADKQVGSFDISNNISSAEFKWYFDEKKVENLTEEAFLSEIFSFLRKKGHDHILITSSLIDYSGWFNFILGNYNNSQYETTYDIYRCLYDFKILEDYGDNKRIYCLKDPDSNLILCSIYTSFIDEDNLFDDKKAFYLKDAKLYVDKPNLLKELIYNCELKAADVGISLVRYITEKDDLLNKYCSNYSCIGLVAKEDKKYFCYEEISFLKSYRKYK